MVNEMSFVKNEPKRINLQQKEKIIDSHSNRTSNNIPTI